MHLPPPRRLLAFVLFATAFTAGCRSGTTAPPSPGDVAVESRPRGDEIVAAGKRFHTGAPVVLWTDPGGYRASPANFGRREQVLSDGEAAEIQRNGGRWPLDLLRDRVDQFVLHYDVAGVSKSCFRVLETRGLSVHFMLDLDGTVYQTCDLQERTYHGTKSNPRSVGIEIANMGAYTNPVALKEWYTTGADGRTVINIPARLAGGGIRDTSVVLRPDRNEMVVGQVHGKTFRQYDLTPQQYDSLAKLTAALATMFPRITVDYPRGPDGKLITTVLSDDQWRRHTGVLGHYHVQKEKQDPGPAMQWDRLMSETRKLMSAAALRQNEAMRGKAVTLREGKGTGAKPATQAVK
jgi:N-acetylmuramoyl-L-alanine amidase